jgi:hypothetical protein
LPFTSSVLNEKAETPLFLVSRIMNKEKAVNIITINPGTIKNTDIPSIIKILSMLIHINESVCGRVKEYAFFKPEIPVSTLIMYLMATDVINIEKNGNAIPVNIKPIPYIIFAMLLAVDCSVENRLEKRGIVTRITLYKSKGNIKIATKFTKLFLTNLNVSTKRDFIPRMV